MKNILFIILGVSIVAIVVTCILFFLIVELSYYNKPELKFHNDEIDISNVKFEYRNILDET